MALPNQIRQSISKQSRHVLETGSRFKKFDQLRQRHFWSSYYFTPNTAGYIQAGTFPVFIVPPGQNGQGFPSGVSLTERETNWRSSNRVPDNQNFEITELGVSLGMVPPDVWVPTVAPGDPITTAIPPRVANQFLNNTLLNITYLTNSVPLGLVSDFGQASAPHAGSVIADSNVTKASFRSNGMPAPALRRRFKIPILLQHGETFAFTFVIPRDFFIGAVQGAGNSNELISPVIMRLDFWATESFVEKS